MLPLHEGERVIAEFRRHWFVIFAEGLPLFLLAFLPAVLWWGRGVVGALGDSGIRVEAFLFFATTLWLLALWLIFFILWTNYYLDVLIMTDRRIVRIEQHTFFSREIAECRLDKIQDIGAEMHGLIATVFKFGNLHLQTAAEGGNFSMKNIPDPYEAKELIARLHNQAMQEGGPKSP